MTSRNPLLQSQCHFLLFMCTDWTSWGSADMTWWCNDDNWIMYEIFKKSSIEFGSQSWMWTITVGHRFVKSTREISWEIYFLFYCLAEILLMSNRDFMNCLTEILLMSSRDFMHYLTEILLMSSRDFWFY